MSVNPGAELFKDPSAVLVYEFDWTDWLGTASITTSTFAIAGPDNVLTKDNPAILAGSKKTHVRLLAGTLGKIYTLTNQIVTDESPTQTDERSIRIKIRNL
jgi:hypothetical protein